MEMKLLNKKGSDNNFIVDSNHQGHIIEKYEFRSIDKELGEEIAPALEESGIYTPSQISEEGLNEETLKSKVDELLEGYKQLVEQLQQIQEQIKGEDSSQKWQKMLEEAKKDAYEQGLLEGERKAKEEMIQQVEEERKRIIISAQDLQKALGETQEQIGKIEEDLSVIALDLAKEVILKEVQEGSKEIALQIANELLKPLLDSQNIVIKANPFDIAYLQDKLSEAKNITFEVSELVGKGGVIIASSRGNYDGSILSRYKNLKRSILEDKGL